MSLDNGDNIISVLVEKCKFIERFSEAFKKESDRTVGYLGHLVHLANELTKASTYHEPLAKLLDGIVAIAASQVKAFTDRCAYRK